MHSKLSLILGVLLYTTVFHGQSVDWALRLANDSSAQSFLSYAGVQDNTASPDGGVLIGGILEDTVNMNPLSGNGTYYYASEHIGMLAKYSPAGYLQWLIPFAERNSNPAGIVVNEVAYDHQGGIYVVGYFSGTYDFDPVGTNNITSQGTDGYVAKYNAQTQQLEWVSTFGCTGGMMAVSDIEIHNGTLIISGGYDACGTMDAVDFDPGAGTTPATAGVDNNIFFAKYDLNGNYIYHRKLPQVGATINVLPIHAQYKNCSMKVLNSGSIVLRAAQNQVHDLDPSVAVSLTEHTEGVLMAMYQANGDFAWGGSIATNLMDLVQAPSAHLLEVDDADGVYIAGAFNQSTDFDIGMGAQLGQTAANFGSYLCKYDTSGALQWLDVIGTDTNTSTWITEFVRQQDSIVVIGVFNNSLDLDPTPSSFILQPDGFVPYFFAKYALSTGDILNGQQINRGFLVNEALSVNANNDIYLTATYDTLNFTIYGDTLENYNHLLISGGALVLKIASGSCGAVALDSISPDATLCLGDSTQLFAQANGSVNWLDSVSNGEFVAPESSTSYFVEINDTNGCYRIDTVQVNVETSVDATFIKDDVLCNGAPTGAIAVLVSSGGSYEYDWSNGETDPIIGNLFAGTYTVTVTGASGGCDTVISIDILQNEALQVDFTTTPILCFGDNNGGVSASVSGGTSPYAYQWNNGAQQSANSPLNAGTYTITVTDINNCGFIGSVELTQPDLLVASIDSVSQPTTLSPPNGYASASATGGTMAYAFEWSNGTIDNVLSNGASQSYSVEVTDANGCVATDTVTFLPVGIGEREGFDVKVYPNPATDLLTIETKSSQPLTGLTLINALGANIDLEFSALGTGRYEASVAELPSGFYVLLPSIEGWQSEQRTIQIIRDNR